MSEKFINSLYEYSEKFYISLSQNRVIYGHRNEQVFQAEAYAGPGGIGRFDLTKDDKSYTLDDIVKKIDPNHDFKAVRATLFNKKVITIRESIVQLLNENGEVEDFDFQFGFGLYFEHRPSGMWWALYKNNNPGESDDWSWWEGEVQCFEIENVNHIDRWEAVAMWKEKTGAGQFKQAHTFSTPEKIGNLVKGLE